ncbi:uncharacterized protein G2W53_008790 [Senna tora]|uniref:Uncharacterized protein n=1 Tax=Senna tora TaxID=362788 RepID=A0A834WWR7_9FABA|nr:uncharacterized protein G2W53_008790 [Senna tora]
MGQDIMLTQDIMAHIAQLEIALY